MSRKQPLRPHVNAQDGRRLVVEALQQSHRLHYNPAIVQELLPISSVVNLALTCRACLHHFLAEPRHLIVISLHINAYRDVSMLRLGLVMYVS